jgi:ribosomal protein S18 acetylase RimI-like enzyme
MQSSLRLRPAREDDRNFLLQVYGSTRAHELASVPWTAEQKAAFVLHQFEAQSSHYHTHYEGAQFLIIELEGKAIGRLYIHELPERIHIMDIALLPEARNHGIGRTLLEQLQSQGREQNKKVTIYVEFYNPAKRLYERLGFQKKSAEGEIYEFMEWIPQTKGA